MTEDNSSFFLPLAQFSFIAVRPWRPSKEVWRAALPQWAITNQCSHYHFSSTMHFSSGVSLAALVPKGTIPEVSLPPGGFTLVPTATPLVAFQGPERLFTASPALRRFSEAFWEMKIITISFELVVFASSLPRVRAQLPSSQKTLQGCSSAQRRSRGGGW